jgi:hypothetical protein
MQTRWRVELNGSEPLVDGFERMVFRAATVDDSFDDEASHVDVSPMSRFP